MHIREATPRDARAIAGMLADCWRAAFRGLVPDDYLASIDPEERAARIEESFSAEGATSYVAESDGEIAGFTVVGICRDEDAMPGSGEVWGLYVAPSFWRQGVGTMLCRHAEQVLREAGDDQAVIWTFEGNRKGIGFWEAMGFRADGARTAHDFAAFPWVARYRKQLSDA